MTKKKSEQKQSSSDMNQMTWLNIAVAIILIFTLINTYGIFSEQPATTAVQPGGSGAVQQPPAAAAPVDITADDDPFLGPEDAPVTVIEFSDFECPFCGGAMGTHQGLVDRFKGQDPSWEPVVPRLKELAEEGKIKFVFRDFPLNIHPNAQKAGEASECADDQGKFWEYHDKLFEVQTALTVPDLKRYAGELGLDQATFDECLDSGKYTDEVKKDFQEGAAAGVRGTPAFFINGQLIEGAVPAATVEQIINSMS